MTVQTIAQLNFEKQRLDDFIERREKKSKKSLKVRSFKIKHITPLKANISQEPKIRKIDENIPRFPIHIFKSLQKVKPESNLDTPTVSPLPKLDDKILPVNVFWPENVTITDHVDLSEDFQLTTQPALKDNKTGILYEERNYFSNISDQTVEKAFKNGAPKINIQKNLTELHEKGNEDDENSTPPTKSTPKELEKTEARVHKYFNL